MDGVLAEIMEDVPEEYQPRFREIVALTDAFCDEHLNDEYKLLTRELAGSVCQKNSPARRGKAASWAAGVTYTIGWVNFLSSSESEPHMRSEDIAKGFGVSPATMMAKSREIREALQIMQLNPEWCLPSLIDENPLTWMVEVDGFIVDMRHAPREIQEKAYEQGLIPYVPEERQVEPGAGDDVIAKIGPGSVVKEGEADQGGGPDFPGDLLLGPGSLFDGMLGMPERPAPPKKRRDDGPAQIFSLKITLRHTKPPVWRRVDVPGDTTLGELHDIIQAVMGWEDEHMHQFTAQDGVRFGSYRFGHGGELGEHDEDKFRLHDIVGKKGDKFTYEYDFGDCWEHQILVHRVDPPDPGVKYPVCVSGKLACPPEDCGGLWGYYSQLEARENPKFAKREGVEVFLPPGFDPETFDIDAVNKRLGELERRPVRSQRR